MNKKYAPEGRGVFFIVSVADNRKFETRVGFQGRRSRQAVRCNRPPGRAPPSEAWYTGLYQIEYSCYNERK